MSRAIKIDPVARTVEEIDIPATHDAVRPIVGQQYFDYARLGSNVVALVDDMGLRRVGQHYWHFKQSKVMMAGIAVMFSFGDEDLESLDPRVGLEQTRGYIEWLGTAKEAEQAILKGIVDRPLITINDEVIWAWCPDETKNREQETEK